LVGAVDGDVIGAGWVGTAVGSNGAAGVATADGTGPASVAVASAALLAVTAGVVLDGAGAAGAAGDPQEVQQQ